VHRAERLAVRGDLVHETIDDIHVRERRLAERDRARRDETLDHGRMTLRDVSLERASSARRRKACDGNLILHRERQPGRRAELGAASARPIDGAGSLQHAGSVDRRRDVGDPKHLVLLQQFSDVCFGGDVAAQMRATASRARGREEASLDCCACAAIPNGVSAAATRLATCSGMIAAAAWRTRRREMLSFTPEEHAVPLVTDLGENARRRRRGS
jgi:hypothetical protein